MRIVLVADSFPPLKNSAAVLVFSLAEAMASKGHEVLVITPSVGIGPTYVEDDFGTFKVLRIPCGKIKSHHNFLRGINELSMFFSLPRSYKKTPYAQNKWDLLVWYSPTIFLGGLVKVLKKRSKSSYLVLRDIVPDWMVDIGLIKKGPTYFLLKWFENFQYQLADIIGVQSPGNKKYFKKLDLPNLKRLEVLPNWMPSTSTRHQFRDDGDTSINLQNTILAGRKVFIYAGNLGEAQGIENFAHAILSVRERTDCGFLIIGRGSKKEWLYDFIESHGLQNVLLLDEVDLVALSNYYRQSFAGLVFLDPGHQSHNIPGKFISYLEASLPVVACVNPGNDLINIILDENLGLVVDAPNKFPGSLIEFMDALAGDNNYARRARLFYERNYQPGVIADQILNMS
jgi:glycosyltransferase involved in cell wall biosynthesis